eukprot:m.75395 g.75395  ORF g.75395 m.75395 type:complete len:108 (-) comp16172_c1_seq6:102-425(-)
MAEQYALVRGSHFRLCGKVPAQAPTQSQRQTPGLALDWLEVLESFGIVGLLDSEQEDCIAALATILHTGNIVCTLVSHTACESWRACPRTTLQMRTSAAVLCHSNLS